MEGYKWNKHHPYIIPGRFFLSRQDAWPLLKQMLNKPDYFKTLDVVHPNDKLNRPEIFLSIDFQEDYRNMLKIYNLLKKTKKDLSY